MIIIKQLKKLKNNKGFTLLELMVSVAIFALIISPLIHAFLTSMETSRRSHFLGDATLATRNIIETVKARSASSVIALLDGGNTNPFTSGTIANFDDSEDGIYRFDIMDYSAGMSRFDLRVTLNADEYDAINNIQVTDYSPMDGVFAQPVSDTENPDILAEIYLENLAVIHGMPFNANNIRRKITISADENENETRITATYVYTLGSLTSNPYYYEFYRGRSVETMKSVYFCYKPFYRGTDTIEIENTADMNLSVFVVKQPTADDLFEREATYNAEIHLQSEENTKVFSNFNINLNPLSNGARLPGCRFIIGGWNDRTEEISGELVSRTQHERMFKITIQVFARGELGGRPMLRTEAAQLD